MCVMLSRRRHACIVVGRLGAERLMFDHVDTAPVIVGEPDLRVDGWKANLGVLDRLRLHRVGP